MVKDAAIHHGNKTETRPLPPSQPHPKSLPEGTTIVFDLDGTLVDTAPDLLLTLNTVLGEEGRDWIDAPHVRELVGRGARVMIEEGLKLTGAPGNKAQIDDLFDRFVDLYARNIDHLSRPFDGVVEALDRFAGAGARLGVCTNKREALSVDLLTKLDLIKYFPVVLGVDSLAVHKPDPAHLTQTIARLGGDETRAIMVGDSITDVKTAQAAGIPVIVVDFGYTEIPPQDLGGDALVSHYREIPEAVERLLARA